LLLTLEVLTLPNINQFALMSINNIAESSEVLSNSERRGQITKEIDILKSCLPENVKSSQIRCLKAACTFIRKEKHFKKLHLESRISNEEKYLDYCKDYFSKEVSRFCFFIFLYLIFKVY
jgi:hypothetical protein